MRVLLTNAENHSVVSMIRALGKKGYQVFAVSKYSLAPGFYSKYVKDFFTYPSSGYEIALSSKLVKKPKEERKFVNLINSLINKWNIDLLIPCYEDTLIPLSKNRDYINAVLPLPEHEKIMMVHNKTKFLEFCIKNKISIPKSFFPTSEAHVKEIISKEKLPIIVKPSIGSGGTLNTYLCNTRKEVLDTYRKNLKLGKESIIQEYIDGEYYSSIFVLDKKSNILASFCCKSIGLNLKFPISKINPRIIKISKKIFKKIGLVGIVSSQFIVEKNGIPKILEINPRIISGITDLAIKCGINIPHILCKVFWNEKLILNSGKDGFVYVLPHHFFHFLKEFGVKSALNYILGRKIKMDCPLEDPLSFLTEYYYHFQKKLNFLN